MTTQPGWLVFLRHGESTANRDGLFTGIWDVHLTKRGLAEARAAAEMLHDANLIPDVIFTSAQTRTQQTVAVVLEKLNLDPSTVQLDWRLNERNYGNLTGRTKADVRAEFGEEQFFIWRRTVNGTPPPLPKERIAELARPYVERGQLLGEITPTECLADVIVRVKDFIQETLYPTLKAGGNVLLVAHGNSLRALLTVVDSLPDAVVEQLNLPTGHPLVYQFDAMMQPVCPGGRYLDEETAHAAAAQIAAEGGT